jgi:hypothetical protein
MLCMLSSSRKSEPKVVTIWIPAICWESWMTQHTKRRYRMVLDERMSTQDSPKRASVDSAR